MTFEESYNAFILGKKITSWGFQQHVKKILPNSYYAYPADYCTVFENKYKMIFNGASLGKTDI